MKNKYYGIILLAAFIMTVGSTASARTFKSSINGFLLYHEANNTITFEGKVQRRDSDAAGSFRLVLTNDSPVYEKTSGRSVMNVTIKDAPDDVMRALSALNYKLPGMREMKDMGNYPLSGTTIVVEAQMKKPTGDQGLPDFIFKSFSKNP